MDLLLVFLIVSLAEQLPVIVSGSMVVEVALRLFERAFDCRRKAWMFAAVGTDDEDWTLSMPDLVRGPELSASTTWTPVVQVEEAVTEQPYFATFRLTRVPTLVMEQREERFRVTVKSALRAVKKSDLSQIRSVAPFPSVSVDKIVSAAAAVLSQQAVETEQFERLVEEAVCAYHSSPVFGFSGVSERFLDLMKVIYMLFRTYTLSPSDPDTANSCLYRGLGLIRDLQSKHYEGPIVF